MAWDSIYRKRIEVSGANILGSNTKNTIRRFNAMFKDVVGYKSGRIDGIDANFLVEQHTNPLNADQIDKKLFCELESSVKIGSIVEYDSRKFLVVTKPESNLAYLSSKMVECNNFIAFAEGLCPSQELYPSEDLVPIGDVIYPCIVTNNLTALRTIEELKYINLSEDMFLLIIQFNNNTNSIRSLDKLIISGSTFEVQAMDNISSVYGTNGIIKMTVKRVLQGVAIDTNNTITASDWFGGGG